MAKPWHNGLHVRIRAQVAKAMTMSTACVLCGQVRCPKTGQVLATQHWHLAHDDDRSTDDAPVWLGPAHPHCNDREWANSPRSKRGRSARTITPRVTGISRGTLRRIARGEIDEG